MGWAVRRWVIWAAVGTVIGLALGFAIGWWLWPVEYTNTAPGALHPSYADDYVLMVAATYGVDGDLQRAAARLGLLDRKDPAAPAVSLAQRLIESQGDEQEIAQLASLARALGAQTPALAPYLEGEP